MLIILDYADSNEMWVWSGDRAGKGLSVPGWGLPYLWPQLGEILAME